MQDLVQLSSCEIVVERKFTHPHHTFYDRRLLCYMLQRMYDVVASAESLAPQTISLHLQQLELDGRAHRIVLNQPAALKQADELVIVGFFGQRRYEADSAEINALDQKLVYESAEHTGLFCYSTLELTNGDTANCVVFQDEQAKYHWRTSITHARAAGVISPTYYYSIRLYNGHIQQGGLANNNGLALTCVKYYDFKQGKVWRAIRPFENS